MIIHKLLAGTLALVLVAGFATPAFASLIGDTVNIEANNLDLGTMCNVQTVVIVGPENVVCGQYVVDVEESSIWIQLEWPNNVPFPPVTWDFTDLDWTNNPQGIIVDAIVSSTTYPLNPISFGDHSVAISNPAFTTDCGQTTCNLDFHIDLVTDHGVVGGELLSVDSTALVLAGMQSISVWMIPTIAGIAAVGLSLIKFRKN